tara:strand:+ start:832 stop:1482 length:651 start_codon:yes stop_codon:yes gene_type:complete
MPPEYLKIWVYLIGKANHAGRKYKGFYCERGQYFCDYNELREQLEHKIGYRKKKFNENHMKNLMKHLREAGRITTTKKPRGILITILNYDDYQNLTNYEKTNEKTNEKTRCKPDIKQKPPSINKNYKELKKYITSFDLFWKEYPKKKDKKKALIIWTTKIQPESGSFEKIMAALKEQKDSKEWQKDGGAYIPHPTTWLNGERWNDENKKRERTRYC